MGHLQLNSGMEEVKRSSTVSTVMDIFRTFPTEPVSTVLIKGAPTIRLGRGLLRQEKTR